MCHLYHGYVSHNQMVHSEIRKLPNSSRCVHHHSKKKALNPAIVFLATHMVVCSCSTRLIIYGYSRYICTINGRYICTN